MAQVFKRKSVLDDLNFRQYGNLFNVPIVGTLC
jgi:hypothetical protein